jgi:RNA-directed DNA polymerase
MMEAVVERENMMAALRRGGRSLRRLIQEVAPLLRGWMNYFRLSEVKGVFEELDGWIRRKLRCILWRQWKRSRTRARNLMKLGLEKARAWQSATNGHGPWWNSGASHMNKCLPKRFFDARGLVSLLSHLRWLQCTTRTAVVRNRMPGGVGGGGVTPASSPIPAEEHGRTGHIGRAISDCQFPG